MIKVSEVYQQIECTDCGSENNIKEIIIGTFTNPDSVSFVICESCSAKLIEMLIESY